MHRFAVYGLLITSLVCAQVPRQSDGSVSTVPVKAKKKSRKKLWIGIAVASAATIALIAVDKRLSNEGRGIFR